MLLHCVVLLFCLNFVCSSEVKYSSLIKNVASDVDERFSSWPSLHNGVRLMRIRKREAVASKANPPPIEKLENVEKAEKIQTSESPSDQSPSKNSSLPAHPLPVSPVLKNDIVDEKAQKTDDKVPVITNQNATLLVNSTETNVTTTDAPKINLSDPGVIKRAAIVFGGFALLGTAYYFIFYRKKNNTSDAKNTHGSIDPNQFRYGVLKSEDRMSNLELSRVPLTMESDDDEEEDLEIFDLGQKKKSLSYINLQQHDDEIVLNDSKSIDMENILVDIEDKNSDQLINWSSTGNIDPQMKIPQPDYTALRTKSTARAHGPSPEDMLYRTELLYRQTSNIIQSE